MTQEEVDCHLTALIQSLERIKDQTEKALYHAKSKKLHKLAEYQIPDVAVQRLIAIVGSEVK